MQQESYEFISGRRRHPFMRLIVDNKRPNVLFLRAESIEEEAIIALLRKHGTHAVKVHSEVEDSAWEMILGRIVNEDMTLDLISGELAHGIRNCRGCRKARDAGGVICDVHDQHLRAAILGNEI